MDLKLVQLKHLLWAGVCNGASIEVTFCEDTDGDGLGNPGSETTDCVSGGRDVSDGCDNSVSGGDAGSAGFMIQASGDMVLAFSMTGATFGPCGTMVNLDIDGDGWMDHLGSILQEFPGS